MDIALSYPSEDKTCVVDLKKGRSTISFTEQELAFLVDFYILHVQHTEAPASNLIVMPCAQAEPATA